MVKIRFRRMGAKKRPFYRIVVGDSRRHPSKGNQPTDSVKELFKKHGIL